MKKITLFILMLTSLLMLSCSEELADSDVQGLQEFSKAGTNLVNPNIFDVNGNLCEIGMNRIKYSPEDIGKPMELWVGVGNDKAGTLVGHVTFINVDGQDKVRIDLTDADGDGNPDAVPFVINTAHIHFGPTVDDIPHTRKGNPIPGKFEYNVDIDPNLLTIDIDVEFDQFGAIHLAVTQYGGVEGFNFYLPDNQVSLSILQGPTGGANSFWKFKIEDGGFISEYDMGNGAGVYEGWCIDTDHWFDETKVYGAFLYSSYEELPEWMTGEGNLEKPYNFDKINYLINNYEVGDLIQPVESCGNNIGSLEAITYGDMQRAIWHFMDDEQFGGALSDWSQDRVNAIICDVDEYGEGFVPGCNDKIVFLVVPTDSQDYYDVQIIIGQPIIGEIPVPCKTSEGTAWGDGYYGATFPGSKQWGTWFERSPDPCNK